MRLETTAHFDAHRRGQHRTSIVEEHRGTAVEYLFIGVRAVSRVRRSVEIGQPSRAAPIVAYAQEQGASSRIHEFARLVAQQDLRAKTLSALGQVPTVANSLDHYWHERYVGTGQPSTATQLRRED